jgi:hypothetical protein
VIARHSWIYAGPIERVGDQIIMRGAVNTDKWLPFLKRFASSKNKTSKNKRRKR